MKELKEYGEKMRAALNAEMMTLLNANGSRPDLFYGMMQYHMGWVDQNLEPVHVNAGKQIRPVLALLVCAAAGGDWQQAVPAGAAIELLHNFSLIHDDIEDASPTRRGRETVWSIWGQEQAINTGDAMFAVAHLALNRLHERGVAAAVVVRAMRRFDETSIKLTQGQHADMDFETRQDVQVEEYIEMITGKTAVLLSLCTELGGLIAGCDPDTIANYRQFGLDLGLAFQVKDDILGIWGDEALIGKSASTDILTKKKTLPVLYGLAKSSELRTLYAQAEADAQFVAQVVALLDETGAREYSFARAADYSESALSRLEAARPSGTAYQALNQLTEMLLTRNY